MAIEEIFPNPVLKSVHCELKFPNLFFLESKVGEIQTRILERFPDSALIFMKHFLIAETAPGGPNLDAQLKTDSDESRKAWQFKSPQGYFFRLDTNSILISSNHHKTYMLDGGDKFRDVIAYVVSAFLSVVQIPKFTRIGLRYIDHAPLPVKNDETLNAYYDTTFPIDRFSIDNATEMKVHVVVRQGDAFLRYAEQLMLTEKEPQLILDFDAYRENVQSADYLAATDQLHLIVSNAFEQTIKKPVYDHMRKPRVAEATP